MRYDKLVRDKIPEIIKEKGGDPKTHIADEYEYKEKLRAKLQEEVKELLDSEDPAEIADIVEVLEAIAELKGYKWNDIIDIQWKKATERGKFKERIILEES